MPSPRRRVLVLGLDGGTFDLLDPLMRAGVLPFLRSLVQKGLRAPHASVYPPKTIPAWYSFATGMDPGSLGIFGFTEPDGGPGKSRIVQSFRPAEAVWDHLSRRGVPVGVLNFPLRAGYPIHGFVVPGMLSDNPPTYPKELRASLEEALGEPLLPELPAYRGADREGWMSLATRGVEQRGRSAELLCSQYRPEFLFVLFRETDRIQHQHWAELSGPSGEVGSDLIAFWRGIDTACARIEAAFRAAGGPCVTLVISDHGHGAAKADFFTNRWLAQEGFLRFKNGDATGRRATGSRRRLVARALLLSERFGWTRRVVRSIADRLRGGGRREAVGKFFAGESSFESMSDQIDWQRTTAFSYPVPEGIYLNRYNPTFTDAQKLDTVREIRRRLETYTGAHIEVFEPKDIYTGTNLTQAPALLLKIDDLGTEPRMDFSYPDPMLRTRPGFFYGSGVHRMNGILIAAGDGVASKVEEIPRSILDLAPTILETMDVPVPPGMTGRSFAPLLGEAAT
ncbi:MAG: alkaline phosphatase family protein [Thermoplasmata archaeon]|nr:alkaline phosphatase family protein [Thermoplasmata archaeon]